MSNVESSNKLEIGTSLKYTKRNYHHNKTGALYKYWVRLSHYIMSRLYDNERAIFVNNHKIL